MQNVANGTQAWGAVHPTEELVPISDVALLAMIYYNRGVEALRAKKYQQAIAKDD